MKDDTGERIREARIRKGMTQAEVGDFCGLSDAAIRLYELGKRTPSEGTIERLSIALGVAPESLKSLTPESDREALEVLFRLEEKRGCSPAITGEGKPAVAFDRTGSRLGRMLADWSHAREKLERGELSQEQYEEWQSRYRG